MVLLSSLTMIPVTISDDVIKFHRYDDYGVQHGASGLADEESGRRKRSVAGAVIHGAETWTASQLDAARARCPFVFSGRDGSSEDILRVSHASERERASELNSREAVPRTTTTMSKDCAPSVLNLVSTLTTRRLP